MSSSRDEDRQQALSHHPQQDLVPPASRPSPPGDTGTEGYVGSSHLAVKAASLRGRPVFPLYCVFLRHFRPFIDLALSNSKAIEHCGKRVRLGVSTRYFGAG